MNTDLANQKTATLPPPLDGHAFRRVSLTPISRDDDSLLAEIATTAERRRASFLRRYWKSLLFIWLPMTAATIYITLIASNMYVSETKYIVRSASSSSSGDDGLGAFRQSQGLARAIDETYAVNEFLMSRDAANQLAQTSILKDLMSRPEGDIFNRFPNPFTRNDEERFYRAYLRFVDVKVDNETGISTIEVNGFRPKDSFVLAQALLKVGEAFVNTLNDRAHQDSIEFAEASVKQATERLTAVENKIADYRNKQLIVDPSTEASASIGQVGAMATEVSRMEAALSQQIALTPNSPTIAATRQRIQSFRDEMAKLQAQIVGGKNSLADKIKGFELLSLEQGLAAKNLAAATVELQKAHHDAESQRIYLQKIVEPNMPDQPMLPRRLIDWLMALAICLSVYWLVRAFTSTTMDHQA